MNIACHNVENLAGKIREPDYVEYIKSFDIFCALETFTTETFDFSIHFSDFMVFHSPAVKLSRKGRVSGGVVVFVNKKLSEFVTCIKTPYDHMVCLKISKTLLGFDNDSIFTFVYVPPYQSPYYANKDFDCHIHKLEELLLQTLEGKGDIPLILMGDFNSRIDNWTLEDDDHFNLFDNENQFGFRQSKDKVVNQFGKLFIEFCNMFSLVPLNGNATGDEYGNFTFVGDQGNSVVDYALVTSDIFEKVNFCFHVVGDRVESKHVPIHVTLPVTRDSVVKAQNNKSSSHSTYTRVKWDRDKVDEFMSEISSEQSLDMLDNALSMVSTCIDTALDMFNNALLKAADCMFKTVRIKSGQQATNRWFNKECADKKRLARKASTKFHKTDDPEDRVDYLKMRNEYSSFVKEKSKSYKNEARDNLLKERKNSSRFWSLSKELRRIFRSGADINITEWAAHFKKIFNPISAQPISESPNRIQGPTFHSIPELDNPISENEIKDAIKNLKFGKASGPDNICAEFLKHSEFVILPFLCTLYNRIFDACYFPFEWTKAIIVPLLKNGDEKNPDNYRGISLLSILSKIFTSILNKRLYNWAETNDKISPEQAGFRRSFSTIDHIFTIISIVQSRFNSPSGGKVYACFIDYRKAFDSVDRSKVWDKFHSLSISTKMIKILQAIYSNVFSCVRWNGNLSEFFSCPVGLKQGCLLSPIMFSLLIGDVADHVRAHGMHGFQLIPGGPEIFSLLFADDIVLLSSTPRGLQKQIDNLHNASVSLGLSINLDKTKVMVFRKGGFLGRKEKWNLAGTPLDVVNSYKYLGYTLTTQLSENIACDIFASKAKGKVLDIMKTMWCIGSMNTKIFFQFFDSQVKPMLLYASEIWGICKISNIEAAHLFAIKRLLSVSDKSPNHMVYGETGRYPLYIDSTLSSIRYWFKLLKMPESRYPKQCLLHMTAALNRRERFYTPFWVQNIRDCLIKFGFQNVWNNQGTQNEAAMIRDLKAKMIEDFIQNWNQKIVESDRFSVYCSFKRSFRLENYLNNITIKRFRDVLIRFRLGINDLGINRRFQGNSQNNKNCPFCPNLFENETHVLFVCYKYNELRKKYLESICNERVYSLNYIVTNLSMENERNLGMYLFYCMKLRDSNL